MKKSILLFLVACLAANSAWAGFPPTGGARALLRSARMGKPFLNPLRSSPTVSPHFLYHKFSSPQVMSAHDALENSVNLLANAALESSLFVPPSIKPLDNNIQRFVFTVSPKGYNTEPVGSGFVFAQNLPNGTVRLWGITTADIATRTGPDVRLTFTIPQERPISFPGKIVAQGSADGSNAALIEVPEDIAEVALPVIPSTRNTVNGGALAYGFHDDGNLYKMGLAPFMQTSERGLAHTSQLYSPLAMQGGLVVDANGHALGIYNTSYDAAGKAGTWVPPHKRKFFKDGLNGVSEFIPLKHVEYLLREYETPHSAARVVLFNGQIVGKIELNESIMQIDVTYDNATPATLEKNPLWSLHDLDKFIPDLDHATRVYVHIAGPDGQYKYTYDLDLKKNRFFRVDGML